MRNFSYKKYIELIEHSKEPIFRKQMIDEYNEISKIKDAKSKTFIDLGAGHGRILPLISKIGKEVISIEINPNMLPELKKRTSKVSNAKIIVGDMTKLSYLLANEKLSNPVLLLLQNTIGTIEGSAEDLLFEMKKVANDNKGEIIITFFRSEKLLDWGINILYPGTSSMVGNPDIKKTDLSKGLFESDTGYTSKWRSKEEIDDLKKFFGGQVINEIWTDYYCTLHIKYY